MDRFLRFNRLGSNVSGSFGGQSSAAPTIVVQPADPPPIPAFIQNQSLEARVACDPSNQPALEATVRGRVVLRSDYGDGTNGYTKIEAPSSNSSVTAGPGGLVLNTPGIGPQRVLTCIDPDGLAYWQTPSHLLSPIDPVQCYIRLGSYDVELATNWDQPAGKLRLKIQPFSAAGQILTAQDNDGTCQWQDPAPFPPIPPSPSIYASNVDVPLLTTPTVLYPNVQLESTSSDWSVTVDTVAVNTSGNANFTWQLFNTAGTALGSSTTTNGAPGSIFRLTYQYVFRTISPTEVRMTATATIIQNNNTVLVSTPLRNVAVNPALGMPFPRCAKSSAGSTQLVVSRSAYYNVLNYDPAVALFFRAPDPFDAIVPVAEFADIPDAVGKEEVVETMQTDTTVKPESVLFFESAAEVLPADTISVLSSAPPVKRQRRA